MPTRKVQTKITNANEKNANETNENNQCQRNNNANENIQCNENNQCNENKPMPTKITKEKKNKQKKRK